MTFARLALLSFPSHPRAPTDTIFGENSENAVGKMAQAQRHSGILATIEVTPGFPCLDMLECSLLSLSHNPPTTPHPRHPFAAMTSEGLATAISSQKQGAGAV